MLRYRVYEPETPRDLPLWLVQEWESAFRLDAGAELELAGERWRIVAVEDDPDPDYAGRVYLEVVGAAGDQGAGGPRPAPTS